MAGFPVLYLAPEPDTHFRRLTDAITERWPENPPFGGQFDDVVPHLTVAQGQDEDAGAALLTGLPKRVRHVAGFRVVAGVVLTTAGPTGHAGFG
ncbi:hypothetical protein SCHAM137S_06449 [Streptomyces chartreusis]